MRILHRLKSDTHQDKESRYNPRVPRVGLRMQVAIVPCVEGAAPEEQIAWMRDLSRTGIGLVHDRPMWPGTFFLANFSKGTATLTAVYRVIHCAPEGETHFRIGAALERTLEGALENHAA